MGIRIDALSSTSLPTATHELPAMKDGITAKLTVEQIAEAGLKDQPLKETPVDTDGIALVDSEGGIKRLSWSKLKDAFLSLAGGTMTGLLTLAPADDDPGGTASLNLPAGADTPDVQVDGDLWADSSEDLRYRRGGEDATVYDSVNLPRPEAGEMAAGTETEPRALSAADVRAGVALSKMWESAPQAITAGGLLTIAHTLGVVPKLVQTWLECVTADLGYAPGDEVPMNPHLNAGASASYGQSIECTSTDILVRYGASTVGGSTGAYQILNKGTGSVGVITLANWKLIVRAFA